jgi:hypothetical protein
MKMISTATAPDVLAVFSFIGLTIGYARVWLGFYTPSWALAVCFLLMFINAGYSLVRRFRAKTAIGGGNLR